MDLALARAALAADLEGVTPYPVATNPKQAHAPCILVGPITEIATAGLCAWDLTIPVWFIAPAPGDQKAVDLLAAHVTDVIDALPNVTTADLGTYNIGQGDLPAYQITTTYTAKE